MDSRRPGRLLLELLGSTPDFGQAPPRDAEWAELGEIAALHRLEPWLHALHQANPAIPPTLTETWRAAHRIAAMEALSQRADLTDCVALLAHNGFAPLALKGAFLAHHVWPEPAQRPMRDLDLLLPQDQVLPAWRLLVAEGYAMLGEAKLAIEDHARLEQHMPPLAMPRGSVLELHARVSELDGRLEYATPAGDEAGIIARAIELEGIRYPAPNDMLAHLITHAIYGHRLDCGPLLLGDVRHMVARHAIDWDAFWSAAQRSRWQAGASLVFTLARSYHGNGAIPRHAAEPPPPDAAMLDLARDLLVQDHTSKMFARFSATILSGGWSYVWRRATGKVAGGAEAPVSIDRKREGGRIGWAWSRTKAMVAELADPRVRRQVRQLARFRRWLEQ